MNNKLTYLSRNKLEKGKVGCVALCLFFLFTFSMLKFLPGMLIIQDIFIGIVFLFFILTYLYLLLSNKLKPSSLEKYCIVILVVVPVMSAYTSYDEFAQPFLYGYLSQRGLLLISSTLIFLRYFHTQRVSLADVERSLKALAWINLFANSAAYIVIDPNLLGSQAGFIDAGSGGGDAKLILDTTFITFGFFYYAFSNYRVKRRFKLCAALLFLSYLIFISGGRFALISVVASFFVLTYKWSSSSRLLVTLSKLFASMIFLSVVLYLNPSDKITNLQLKFADAITVVLTGTETSDSSANARIFEVALAEPYVSKNWFFGNGFLSNQWKGGFSESVGYFHPSDIGLYGVVYVFGIFGFFLLLFQFYFSWRYSSYLSLRQCRHSSLSDAAIGYIVFVAFYSITTGIFAFNFEKSLLFTAILYCVVQEDKKRREVLMRPTY